MREDIRLFINGQEVEFSTGPKVNYNYKLTDFSNPTIVKNSYSKTVEIPGTERNNDIFGHIWNLERVQYDAPGGAGFNPLKKTPFELYVGGALKEKGYAKLNTVKKKGGSITYSIQLYGGLGTFLYSLAYDETNGDEKPRTLADLNYGYELSAGGDIYPTSEPELGFYINKDTIANAWCYKGGIFPDDDSFTPSGESQKWNILTFVPAYNGIPEDFDASKVLINHSAIPNTVLNRAYGSTYHTVLNGVVQTNDTTGKAGYSLGEASEDLTEWETKDLRSYLQRPAISVMSVISALGNPSINGGYELKLGERFFARHNDFYFNDAYMTLPLIRDLEIDGGKEMEITGATMSSGSSENTLWVINFTTPQGLGKVNGARIVMEPRLIIDSTEAQPDELHFSHKWSSNANCINYKTVKWIKTEAVYIMQLIARNSNRDIVAQSKAYYFSESQTFPDGTNIFKYFWKDGDEGTKPEYEWRNGYFMKINGEYRFVSADAQQVWSVAFDIPAGLEINSVELKTMTAIGADAELKWWGHWVTNLIPDEYKTDTAMTKTMLYDVKNRKRNACWEAEQVVNDGRTIARIYPSLNSFYGKALDYEAMFSDTYIPKEKLLSTPFTPADFLLSYCKMFGLYIFSDPAEVSSNPDLYPNGVIHILDRTEFYNMYDGYDGYQDPEVVDLQAIIDRSKDMTITPALADSKFYRFEQEPVESEGNANYYDTYGHNYGRQLVDTGYNFDNSVNDLYDTNVFKSAVMCLEKDKYFKPTNRDLQPFVNSTYKYLIYSTGLTETHEMTVSYADYSGSINPDGLIGYDFTEKMQFHEANNEASDGAYVLCTYTHAEYEEDESKHYMITDDVADMVYLNDGTPCWLMSPNDFNADNERIAWHIPGLPVFSRMAYDSYYNNDEKIVVNSWDFGHPREILCPNVFGSDGDSIYDKFWKTYIGDLYSVDDRKLTCYVNLPDNPFPGAMRKFYWFDNSIWRLNEVKDWNVFGLDSTLCEFVKVQDVKNYRVPEVSDYGIIEMFVSPEIVPYEGGLVTISIKNQTGQKLITESDYFTFYGTDKEGNTYEQQALQTDWVSGTYITFSVSMPEQGNATDITWTFSVEDQGDLWHTISFKQLAASVFIDGTINDWEYWETDSRSVQAYSVPDILGITATKTDPGNYFNLNVNGNAITVTPSGTNYDTGDRTATITVTNGVGSKTFTVTQEGYPSSPNIDIPSAYLDWLGFVRLSGLSGREFTAHVSANVEWTASVDANWLNTPWASVEKIDNGTVKFTTLMTNSTGNDILGTVTFSDGLGYTKTYTLVWRKYNG